MTVCIAAICTWDAGNNELMIVGASDRMVSAPNIKFEPPLKKIYHFREDVCPRAIALVAGDPYAQVSICDAVTRNVMRTGKPTGSVEKLAVAYVEALADYRRSAAEVRYLKSIGLSVTDFTDRMQEWTPDFVTGIQYKMENHPVEVEAIIAGIDATGSHLFMVNKDGEMLCADAVSFACIGSGASHAESQFMNAKYQRGVPWQEAITLTSIAKKKSEVSPTVGEDSDFFFIGRDGFNVFTVDIHKHLDDINKELDKKHSDATAEAVAKTRDYLAEVLRRHQEAQAPTAPEDKKPATDPES